MRTSRPQRPCCPPSLSCQTWTAPPLCCRASLKRLLTAPFPTLSLLLSCCVSIAVHEWLGLRPGCCRSSRATALCLCGLSPALLGRRWSTFATTPGGVWIVPVNSALVVDREAARRRPTVSTPRRLTVSTLWRLWACTPPPRGKFSVGAACWTSHRGRHTVDTVCLALVCCLIGTARSLLSAPGCLGLPVSPIPCCLLC